MRICQILGVDDDAGFINSPRYWVVTYTMGYNLMELTLEVYGTLEHPRGSHQR